MFSFAHLKIKTFVLYALLSENLCTGWSAQMLSGSQRVSYGCGLRACMGSGWGGGMGGGCENVCLCRDADDDGCDCELGVGVGVGSGSSCRSATHIEIITPTRRNFSAAAVVANNKPGDSNSCSRDINTRRRPFWQQQGLLDKYDIWLGLRFGCELEVWFSREFLSTDGKA